MTLLVSRRQHSPFRKVAMIKPVLVLAFAALGTACSDEPMCSKAQALWGAETLCGVPPVTEIAVYQHDELIVACWPADAACTAAAAVGEASFVLTADEGLAVTGVTISDPDVVAFTTEFATPQEVTSIEIPVVLSAGTATVTFEADEPLHVDLTVE